jgi:hypothetical protein
MGAKFLALGFLASVTWCGWELLAGEVASVGMIWRVLAVTFFATGAGKLVGVLRYRLQNRGTALHEESQDGVRRKGVRFLIRATTGPFRAR